MTLRTPWGSYADYRGHDWVPTIPLSSGGFVCLCCGDRLSDVAQMGDRMGGCKPRLAPLSWFSEKVRNQLPHEV